MTKINDAIEQNKKLILAQETVAERYPDATLSGFPGDQNAWASPGVLSDADKFLVLVRAEVMATIGTTVEGVTVLFPGYFNIQALLDKMQRNQPEVYEAFVKAVAQELQSK